MAATLDSIRVEVKVEIKKALKAKSTEPLERKYKSFQHTDQDVTACFDQAFRDFQLELISAEMNVGVIEEFITLSIEACRKDILTSSTPVTLLSDIFDLLTLDDCKKMFCYVEHHVHIWKEDLFFSSCKNILLRLCNDLLRRLSKSNSTIFCGRILLFLAKFFPFSERSGLNVVSEFNLENITEYGSECGDADDENDVDAQEGKIFIDYSLYCKFWSLQDFFRNPNQCYDKVQWKVFCAHAASIVSTFEGLKLEHLDKSSSYDKESINNYFSKYLTNQKLLDLQLYDVNFRRFVLVQFLILFQYLTTTVRFKTAYELLPEQKFFIQSTSEKVHSLLKETPPDGEEFEYIVTKIMSREEHWNAWKNDGCPEFRKALPQAMSCTEPVATARPPRRLLGDILKEARSKGMYHMGNTELTKLWNLNPDNLEACKAKERDFLPSLDEFFADAIEEVSNDRLKREDLLKDGYGWRALRLLARRSTHFLYNNLPIRELSAFLEMMIRRIASAKSTTPSNVGEDGEEVEDLFRQSEDPPENDGEFQVPNIIPFRVSVLTVTQFHNICRALRDDWLILAKKLDYRPDEIDFIISHNPEPSQQIRNLLNVWFEEDDDSTLENFLYILEGLELTDAAEEVKLAIEQNKNLTTDTSNSNEND
ncbi:LOW QUALITY PROTEIN: THO complex subunit 1-like [Atheta coriaria]|uniref:LOW QUALITY PROTEIN: THO complex subunit 1-like n=1 Tax=Dalotia coriaria TaxID=877792 RepID=UPI0031F40C53